MSLSPANIQETSLYYHQITLLEPQITFIYLHLHTQINSTIFAKDPQRYFFHRQKSAQRHEILLKKSSVSLHIHRFSLTLSIIITVGSIILFLVMRIRINDYRKEKGNIASSASNYYRGVLLWAVLMTVIDILVTIFCMPTFIYLNLCNYKSVKTTEALEKKEASVEPNALRSDRSLMSDQQPTEQRQTVNPQENQLTAPTPNIQPQFPQQPQTTNLLHMNVIPPSKPSPLPEEMLQTASASN